MDLPDFVGRTPTHAARKTAVVYTAITGGYDTLMNPSVHDAERFDYVCFMDKPGRFYHLLDPTVWRVVTIPEDGLDPTRRARRHKCLAHRYFPEYEWSIYVDGNVDIIGDVGELLARYPESRMLCFRHPTRDCAYAEAEAIAKIGKEDPGTMRRQMETYRSEGFPEGYGLIETNVLIRRHNDPLVVRLMEAWWHEIQSHSRRDQLSLGYLLWKHDFRPITMGDDNVRGKSAFFRWRRSGAHLRATRWRRLKHLLGRHVLWRVR
jgi:hypothetical protein